MAATQRRARTRTEEAADEATLEEIASIEADINLQLDSVKDDVVTIHKMVVAMDRAILKNEWGKVSSISSAIHAFALNISRRVEVCSTQARIANRMLAIIRGKKNA